MTGRFPVAFLRLELTPELVDVNVHPTKLEVRFQDGGRVYSQLLATLRSRFLSTDLTVKVQPAVASAADEATASDPQHLEQHRSHLQAWARGGASPAPAPASQASLSFPTLPTSRAPEFRPFDSTDRSDATTRSSSMSGLPTSHPSPADPFDATAARTVPRTPLGVQLHNRYLVTEHDEGMVVIDQHALHERILYEQLRETVLGGSLESQRLLVPEPVRLAAAEVALVLESRETLARLGIEAEPFGGDTVLVSAYPAMLANLRPRRYCGKSSTC